MNPIAMLAISSLFISAPAFADSLKVTGEWSTECRPDLQCWIAIEEKDGKHELTYKAAARTDASKIVCETSGQLDLVDARVYRGKLKDGQDIEIMLGKHELFLSETDNSPCGEPLAVNGQYVPIGH